MNVREYEQYGIDRERFKQILNYMLEANDEELYNIADQVDPYVAQYLVEHIRYKASYEKLEAWHGIVAESKSGFYRKRRLMFKLANMRLAELEKVGTF